MSDATGIMPGIHPTAIVSPRAELGDSVAIGPYAIVGENCVIGDGCALEARAVLERNVRLGANVTIGIGSAPNSTRSHPPECWRRSRMVMDARRGSSDWPVGGGRSGR